MAAEEETAAGWRARKGKGRDAKRAEAAIFTRA